MSSKYAVIQYPGVVKNVDKALVTFGGIAKMSQEYFRGQNLTVNYHPENFYSKPTVSRRKETTMLIIRARRKKPDPKNASTSVVQASLEVQVLGVATIVHHFNLMFDYQFLPVRRLFKNQQESVQKSSFAEATGPNEEGEKGADEIEEGTVFENMIFKLYPHTVEESLTWLDENETRENSVDLFLPPTAFTKIATCTSFLLCRDTERKQPVPKNLPMGSKLRLPRKAVATQVLATDRDYPSRPSASALKKCQIYVDKLPDVVNKIVEAYRERPMWTKNSLCYRTQLSDLLIKEITPLYAFYIVSGPFGRCWVKYGYDPRADSSSRPYQVVIYTERGPAFSSIPRKDVGIRAAKQIALLPVQLKDFDIYPETLACYKPGQQPLFRQMFYQLCDIKLPIVEEILNTPPPAAYDAVTGWLTDEQIESIRAAIRKEVEEKLGEQEVEQIDVEELL